MSDENSLEQAKQAYKRKASFELLKTGKMPVRKGLVKNICYLIGLGQWYNGVRATGGAPKPYDKYICFDLQIPEKISNNPDFVFFLKKYLEDNLFKYLGKCEIDTLFFEERKISINYCSKEVKWYLIDFDLTKNHSSNLSFLKNGNIAGVSLKKDNEATNKFYSQVELFTKNKKIQDYIAFLEKNGYTVSMN